MAGTPSQPEPFPPGFVDQVDAFFRTQVEDGVCRVVCYDRDGSIVLTIALPMPDSAQAAADYRNAWRIWRGGGSVFLIKAELQEGLPQNEDRHSLGEMPDFGLRS
jgi:hypothetical protein